MEIIDKIPLERTFISIPEAILLFGVTKTTLYRLIRQGKILGTRLLRIEFKFMEEHFLINNLENIETSIPQKKNYIVSKRRTVIPLGK